MAWYLQQILFDYLFIFLLNASHDGIETVNKFHEVTLYCQVNPSRSGLTLPIPSRTDRVWGYTGVLSSSWVSIPWRCVILVVTGNPHSLNSLTSTTATSPGHCSRASILSCCCSTILWSSWICFSSSVTLSSVELPVTTLSIARNWK